MDASCGDEQPTARAEREAWLSRHAFLEAELPVAMSCVRPAVAGELSNPATVIALQSHRGTIALYRAAVLQKPALLQAAKPGRRKQPRILGVVDLERLAKADPGAVTTRFGFWRGRGAKGPGEISDPEKDAERDRLKGGER